MRGLIPLLRSHVREMPCPSEIPSNTPGTANFFLSCNFTSSCLFRASSRDLSLGKRTVLTRSTAATCAHIVKGYARLKAVREHLYLMRIPRVSEPTSCSFSYKVESYQNLLTPTIIPSLLRISTCRTQPAMQNCRAIGLHFSTS